MHPSGIRNPKNHCYSNAVLQYLFCVLITIDHNWNFKSSIEGPISKCLLDTTHNAPGYHGVDELKPKLSKYSNFENEETLRDSFECILLLMDIMDKGCVPNSTDGYMASSYRDSLSALLPSFVLEKNIVCAVCGLRSPSFEFINILYISPTNNASMQELVMQDQDHKQKLYKTCSQCKKWRLACTI